MLSLPGSFQVRSTRSWDGVAVSPLGLSGTSPSCAPAGAASRPPHRAAATARHSSARRAKPAARRAERVVEGESPPRRGGEVSGCDWREVWSRGRDAVMASTLDARRSTLDARRSTLDARRSTLDARRSTLDARRSTLDARRSTLDARRSTLDARRSTLDARRSTLDARRSTLDARRSTLDARRSTIKMETEIQECQALFEGCGAGSPGHAADGLCLFHGLLLCDRSALGYGRGAGVHKRVFVNDPAPALSGFRGRLGGLIAAVASGMKPGSDSIRGQTERGPLQALSTQTASFNGLISVVEASPGNMARGSNPPTPQVRGAYEGKT